MQQHNKEGVINNSSTHSQMMLRVSKAWYGVDIGYDVHAEVDITIRTIVKCKDALCQGITLWNVLASYRILLMGWERTQEE